MNSERHSVSQPVIDVRDVVTRFGSNIVHNGVSFCIERGTVVSLIGGSGSGKTTLLKAIVGLLRPDSGSIHLFGTDIVASAPEDLQPVRNRFGMLFQQGALFSALTVGENVAVPIAEQTDFPDECVTDLVRLRLALAGLAPEVALKMPNELSGGMKKRAALARALALEPELLFLDEPTSGLDPINARAFDALIRTLCDGLGITVVMVTHDLDSILSVSDRVIVLGNGKVMVEGTPEQVARFNDPWVREYFAPRMNGNV